MDEESEDDEWGDEAEDVEGQRPPSTRFVVAFFVEVCFVEGYVCH